MTLIVWRCERESQHHRSFLDHQLPAYFKTSETCVIVSVNVGNLNIQELIGGTCCLRVVKQLTEEVENRRETEFGRPFHKTTTAPAHPSPAPP
ncbi:Hypothetical predicted protein [Cloeon dipterum]|uniref:Uncharacterized protein n=1 Tax=Cloeon dipterum TaxID=197152 RepID=A0A8S1C1I1_9INSE|nr:Hypothetical predicted protein [Cloeon dipterum]